MHLLVLYGAPAVGKLTVARELAQLSGWRLFHNHLVVDALLAVFEFGSPPFIELREAFWQEIFQRASASKIPGLIFTFNPENTVSQVFIDRLVADSRARGDTLHFVELTCPEPVIESRLTSASRHATGKLTSLELYRKLRDAGTFTAPHLPSPALSLDTSTIPPTAAADRILQHLRASNAPLSA
jgi:hypothetical protein